MKLGNIQIWHGMLDSIFLKWPDLSRNSGAMKTKWLPGPYSGGPNFTMGLPQHSSFNKILHLPLWMSSNLLKLYELVILCELLFVCADLRFKTLVLYQWTLSHALICGFQRPELKHWVRNLWCRLCSSEWYTAVLLAATIREILPCRRGTNLTQQVKSRI